MSVAAGLSMMVAALLPWARIAGTDYGALQLKLYEPLAVALVTGGALVAFGAARTIWAGAAGMGTAFAAAVVVIMIHEGVYGGLAGLGVHLGADIGHIGGYGEYALFAAGLAAGAAGVVTVIQREPPVQTKPSHAAERSPRFTLPPR
jgi:hypothetical protein